MDFACLANETRGFKILHFLFILRRLEYLNRFIIQSLLNQTITEIFQSDHQS